MGHVVVGIAPSMQAVRTLEQERQAAGLPLDSIDVIAPDDVEEGFARAGADDALLLDDGATRIPGVSPPRQVELSAGHTLAERLADIDIPDSEIPTYAAALHNGRSIVAYFATPETLKTAQDLFSGTGVAGVRVY